MKTVFIKVRVDTDSEYEARKIVREWVDDGWMDQRIHEVIVESREGENRG